jgi:nucleoside-diphosphate-sugar epimerase
MRRPSNILLFGGSGQIGEALRLCARMRTPAREVRAVPWSTLASEVDDPSRLRAALDGVTHGWEAYDVVFAAGVTDPSAPPEQLWRSNGAFPIAVIEATSRRESVRYLTLGTVFELFPDFAEANAYVDSKRRLWRCLQAAGTLIHDRRVVHVRLHTVYGGRPKPHMFLGQMITALCSATQFRMSSGHQLREYHHVQDVAGALLAILDSESTFGPEPLMLSAGEPVRLVDLAGAVFEACGRPDLLRVGAIAAAPSENERVRFPRSDASVLPFYRDPLVSVAEYVRNECVRRNPVERLSAL